MILKFQMYFVEYKSILCAALIVFSSLLRSEVKVKGLL